MASLRSQYSFATNVAVGCAKILKPALDFLAGGRDGAASASISVVDAAVILLVLFTLVAYLACVTVCFVPAQAEHFPTEDSSRLTALPLKLAFTMVLLCALALVLFLFVKAGK